MTRRHRDAPGDGGGRLARSRLALGGALRATRLSAPRYVVPNDKACSNCNSGSSTTGGSNAITVQRTVAPAAPIMINTIGVNAGGKRPETANNTISAATPSAHNAAMAVPSRPAPLHCSAEKP